MSLQYDHQPVATDVDECEACVVPAGSADGGGLCVRCPFCHKVVNAIVTETSITCPACNTIVQK